MWLKAMPVVAPRAGAWIETEENALTMASGYMSLPARERGLKPQMARYGGARCQSLPARERGLKQHPRPAALLHGAVAPPVGAWIETTSLMSARGTACGRSPRGSVD